MEDEEVVEPPKPPPVGVRNGPGGYDITSDTFGEPQELNRDMSSKIKQESDNNGTSGSNLMAMAQQIQKDREI